MRALVKKLKLILPRGNFIRGVTVLAGGTILGQGLVVLSSPILTRLYTPNDFGVLAVYSSVLVIMVTIASLRYELAIPLPKDDESAANLLILSVLILLIAVFFSGAGVFFLSDQVGVRLLGEELKPYLWYLPLSLFGAGFYQALNYWANRNRYFSLVSYTKVIRSSGQVIIQIIGGLLKLGPVGLIAGFIVSQFLGIGSLLRGSRISVASIAAEKWLKLAIIYKNFPLFTTWASLISVIGIQIPPMLFAKYFTFDIAGFFALTMRVLGIPVMLIGQAVSQVFYPTVAAKEEDSLATRKLVEQLTTTLFILSFALFAVIALNGPFLFTYIFGDYWLNSGRYAQYLAPWFVFSFISSPLSAFVIVKGKQKQALWMTFYESIVRLGVISIGIKYASSDLAIWLFSIAGTIISIIYIAWILKLAESSFLGWLNSIKMFFTTGILLLAGLFMVDHLFSQIIYLIISVATLSIFSFWFWYSIERFGVTVDEAA